MNWNKMIKDAVSEFAVKVEKPKVKQNSTNRTSYYCRECDGSGMTVGFFKGTICPYCHGTGLEPK
jgi:DnaJ-class molecular chaperone